MIKSNLLSYLKLKFRIGVSLYSNYRIYDDNDQVYIYSTEDLCYFSSFLFEVVTKYCTNHVLRWYVSERLINNKFRPCIVIHVAE